MSSFLLVLLVAHTLLVGSLQAAVVTAVLRMPTAQPCWAQASQGTAIQGFQPVKHQATENKIAFQQPFLLSEGWVRAEP